MLSMNGGGSREDGVELNNPMDKFEESFTGCLNSMLKNQESLNHFDRDETRVDVDHGMSAFIDAARDMEAYFLRKRVSIASQKPELMIRDDVNELKNELMRKEELIKKNCEKTSHWQNALADLQSAASTSKGGGPQSVGGSSNQSPGTPGGGRPGSTPTMSSPGPARAPSGLQGPLAFLEKTASTIGLNEAR